MTANPAFDAWRCAHGPDGLYESTEREFHPTSWKVDVDHLPEAVRRHPRVERRLADSDDEGDDGLLRYVIREVVCELYAWSVPDHRALDTVAEWAGPPGIVEIAAGSGYWAHLLQAEGVDVVAFDATPPGPGAENPWHAGATPWTTIGQADATVASLHPTRTLLVAWPPRTESGPFGLPNYRAAGGRLLIYIGEPEGHSCGDSVFWDEVNGGWEPTDEVSLPQWDITYDVLRRYRLR